MMATLERVRKEALARELSRPKHVREGSAVEGHWRHYKNHSVWVEAHLRVAHEIRRMG